MKNTQKQLSMMLLCCCALWLTACSEDKDAKTEQAAKVSIDSNPFPSRYTPVPGAPTLITNVTVLDG
ncbi:amidohydrolase, partial [Alteromonas sp. AMM-1]